jgi:plasmid stability protein
MPTLYVENVPEDLYEALRARARERRTSIAAEVLSLLEKDVPTAKELARRRESFERVLQIAARKPPRPGPRPSAEEMVREDRDR